MARTIELLPIDSIPDAPRNPRIHDTATLDASLGRFGFIEPIVLDERTGRLIAGHGRKQQLIAAQLAGETPPEGVELNDDGRWLVPVVRGWASRDDAEAEAAQIAVNHQGEWETSGLVAMLDDLSQLDDGLLGIGFTSDDISALLDSLGDPTPPPPSDTKLAQSYVERYTAEQIIELAAEHYERVGFPYPSTPLHEKLWQVERLARVEFDDLASTQIAHALADEYHPHKWGVVVDGKRPPLAAVADRDMLRTALRLGLEMSGNVSDTTLRSMTKFVRGHQAAANFRPGFMLRCIREHCPPDGVVLDTSTGFGGRLVGFAASTAGLYVGIDPSTQTDAGNRKLAADLGVSDRVRLICKPAEDVTPDELGVVADLAMTSPPYFAKERYSDESTQSWLRYPAAEDWRDSFLLPMLALQFAVLRPGGVSLVNIADVKIKSRTVPLVQWTIDAAEAAGFVQEPTQLVYALGRVPGQGESMDPHEPLLMFRRPA